MFILLYTENIRYVMFVTLGIIALLVIVPIVLIRIARLLEPDPENLA